MVKPLAGKKVLFVVCQKDFRDEELAHPREEVTAAGAECSVAARETTPATGMYGMTVAPDLRIRDAKAGEYDAVVAVGGRATPDWLWSDGDLHRLLRDAKAAGKVVGGICLSGATLAIAGLLHGTRATCYLTDTSKREMEKAGAIFVDQPVVASGNIITANGPPAAREFGKALVEALSVGK